MSRAGSVADLRSQFENPPDMRTPEQLPSFLRGSNERLRPRALRFSGEQPAFMKTSEARRSASPTTLPSVGPKPSRHVEHVNGVKISVTSDIENELRETVSKQTRLLEDMRVEKEEMSKELEDLRRQLDILKKESKEANKKLNSYHSKVDKYERTVKGRRVSEHVLLKWLHAVSNAVSNTMILYQMHGYRIILWG